MQSFEAKIEAPKRRGLKPGQRHSGQFQKGHDPKRLSVKKYADGQSFRELCRSKSDEALAVIETILNDPQEDSKTRLAAAMHILDRGYGKPLSGVALMSDPGTTDPTKMTTQELISSVNSYLSSARDADGDADDGDAVEAEYTEVSEDE